jgi:hypothetical protein
MQAYPEIKRFVRETLGCSCPDDVFNQIDYQKGVEGVAGRKVRVADRLLIYIVTLERNSSPEESIHAALRQGIEERDRQALNRFRLVLVTSSPEQLRSRAESAFDCSGYRDERSHLHLVSESDVEKF